MPVSAILLISFFALLIFNVPVGYSLGCSALTTILLAMDLPMEIIVQRFFVTFDSFTMMAIPLFMLAGSLMNGSGISERIITLADRGVGHIRGGLAQGNILASMLFAGISGSAAADASGLGSVLIPAMRKRGYDDDFSVVVTAASSTIGPIIPPSIMFILFASIASLSVGQLFIAGLLPGIIVGLSQMITTYFIAKKRNYPVSERTTISKFCAALVNTLDALVMPVIIVGGVLTGIFTATESGAVAVLYALAVGIIRKELTFKKFWAAVYDAAITTGSMMLIIASASVFSWILTIDQFPIRVVNFMLSISTDKAVVTVLILVLLLIVGMFIDGTSALIILVPILFPLAASYGFDPIHFGTFMVVSLLIGGITPPVGILLYICCGIAKIEVKDTFRMLTPYLITYIIVALLIGFVPQFSTLIPNLIYG